MRPARQYRAIQFQKFPNSASSFFLHRTVTRPIETHSWPLTCGLSEDSTYTSRGWFLCPFKKSKNVTIKWVRLPFNQKCGNTLKKHDTLEITTYIKFLECFQLSASDRVSVIQPCRRSVWYWVRIFFFVHASLTVNLQPSYSGVQFCLSCNSFY